MRIVYLFVIVLLLNGCGTLSSRSKAAKTCEQPKKFYVVSHGWHTGIILNRQDLEEVLPPLTGEIQDGEYLEIGWGDERFYQAQGMSTTLALRALFWPTSSVLHVVIIQGTPQSYFSRSEVVEVWVEQAGYKNLLTFVADSFTLTSDNRLIRYGPGLYGDSWFYGAEGVFHAFNTCNTWIAKAVETTGYPISRMTLTAQGLLSQLHRHNTNKPQCYPVH